MEPKRKCKLVNKILCNPKNVRFEDIDKLLKFFGYEVKQPGRGSSHFVYRKKGKNPITVPYKRPFIRDVYVKHIIKQLNLEEFYEEKCEQNF